MFICWFSSDNQSELVADVYPISCRHVGGAKSSSNMTTPYWALHPLTRCQEKHSDDSAWKKGRG